MEGRLGLGLVAPIAGSNLGAAEANLAILAGGQAVAVVVANLDFDMHDGAAGGADLLDLHARLHQGVAAETLRQAVGVDIAGIGEELGELPDAGFGRALAPADAPPEARDVEPVAVREVEDHVGHHRGEPGAGDVLVLNGLQGGLGVEIAVDDQGAAHPKDADARQVDTAHVIHRAHDQELIPRQLLKGDGLVHRLPVEIVVLVDHALRMVRGPGGVHQPVKVVSHPAHGIRPVLGLRERTDIGLRRRIDRDDAGQAGGEIGQLLVRQHKFDPGMVVDIGDFGRRQPVVDRQEDRPDMARPQHKVEEPGTVFHDQSHDIAFADTFAAEPRAGGDGAVQEVRIGDARALVDHGEVIRPLCGVKTDKSRQVMHGIASNRRIMPLYQNWAARGRRPEIN